MGDKSINRVEVQKEKTLEKEISDLLQPNNEMKVKFLLHCSFTCIVRDFTLGQKRVKVNTNFSLAHAVNSKIHALGAQ